MILCTSLTVDDDDDDVLDTLFINGTDDNGVFIFNDLFLLLTLPVGFQRLPLLFSRPLS